MLTWTITEDKQLTDYLYANVFVDGHETQISQRTVKIIPDKNPRVCAYRWNKVLLVRIIGKEEAATRPHIRRSQRQKQPKQPNTFGPITKAESILENMKKLTKYYNSEMKRYKFALADEVMEQNRIHFF